MAGKAASQDAPVEVCSGAGVSDSVSSSSCYAGKTRQTTFLLC